MGEYHDACARLVGNLADEFLVGALKTMTETEVRDALMRYIRWAREAQQLRTEHQSDRRAMLGLMAEIVHLSRDATDLTRKGATDLRDKVDELLALLAQ